MRINKGVDENAEIQSLAISSSKVLLVPYEKRHVETYHEWMNSKEIQEATASESLTLNEEYLMQESWRHDHDKLTFVICRPPSTHIKKVVAGTHDATHLLLGDVNLFLFAAQQHDNCCIGELELMVAPLEARRHGYGRAAILCFLYYIQTHLDQLMTEYCGSKNSDSKTMHLLYLRVKIHSENINSIKLFESIGFHRVSDTADFFGEFEFKLENCTEPETTRLLEKFGIEAYTKLSYVEEVHTGEFNDEQKNRDSIISC
ncbi:hypothetical protein Golomagni_01735 [Golovinomyces magnicellulatus]|nr:hypothetical protein Golomagni_01735 [Golovinomyces magnicellulatus]